MANVGWLKRRGNLVPSILYMKGDLEIWSSAQFIASFPKPLLDGLSYFRTGQDSFSQEKVSLGGVLDLRR